MHETTACANKTPTDPTHTHRESLKFIKTPAGKGNSSVSTSFPYVTLGSVKNEHEMNR